MVGTLPFAFYPYIFVCCSTDSYKSRPRFLTWFRVVEMRRRNIFSVIKVVPSCQLLSTFELAAFKLPYFAVFNY